MRSILVISSAASDTTFLTVEERRAAAGLADGDSSKDPALLAMDKRNAAAICSECNVRAAGGAEPTLRQETVVETCRSVYASAILLSRRHNVEITAFDCDGTALTGTDYEVDPESGILTRLIDDSAVAWSAKKLTITYKAGFVTVPSELTAAANDLFRLTWLNQNRDPSVKSEEIEVQDIDRVKRDFWVGAIPGQETEGAVPAIVAGQLKRFRNVLI